MDNNVLDPDPSQPSGNGGGGIISEPPPETTSPFGDFLKHFGGGNKKGPAQQPPTNENVDQPSADLVNTEPTMASTEGAQVVSEPSSMSSGESTQPLSQETANSSLGSSVNEPTIDLSQQPSAATGSSATTPDLSGVEVQPQVHIAALQQAKNTLEDVAEEVRDALGNINAALGTQLEDKPVDTVTSSPKEPVGLKF